MTWNNATKLHSFSGHDYYSTKPTVVKLKWALFGSNKDTREVNLTLSSNQWRLWVNGKEYLTSATNNEKVLKGQPFKQKTDPIHFYLTKMNIIELTPKEMNNPHKGFSMEELRIEVK